MSLTYDFSERNVLVTGGAKGVGKATVEKFLKAGANVFVVDKDERAITQLLADHPKVKAVATDLRNWDATAQAVTQFGPIHHLVNNAGIIGHNPGNFLDLQPEQVDLIFDLKAIINVSQLVANGITANKVQGATIVNIASVMSKLPFNGLALYSAAKAAVSMLSRSMALELEPLGIRVNTVSSTIKGTDIIARDPASFDVEAAAVDVCGGVPDQQATEQEKMSGFMKYLVGRHIIKRLLTVEETADLTLYLSTSNSSFLTGQGIVIDGGLIETQVSSITLPKYCDFISDSI